MSCLLFICFENFQSNYMGALKHLHGGLNILKNRQASAKERRFQVESESSASAVDDHLNLIFERLDIDGGVMKERVITVQLEGGKMSDLLRIHPSIPSTFDTLREARTSLDQIIRYPAHALEVQILDSKTSVSFHPGLTAQI